MFVSDTDATRRPAEGTRRRVLMLCAHDPLVDPRVRWKAEHAAKQFEVTVLGFNKEDGSALPRENLGGYEIVRIERKDCPLSLYFRQLAAVMPAYASIPLVLGAIVAGPLAVVLLGGYRFYKRFVLGSLRLAIRTLLPTRVSAHLSERGWPFPHAAPPQIALAKLPARARYILNLLCMSFGPAAEGFTNHMSAMPRKPDVVDCNDLDTLLVGIWAKQTFGCSVVYDAHEYYPHSDPYGRWLDIAFFSGLERFLIRRADGIVTVSPPLAHQMKQAYGVDRIYAVPNAEPWPHTTAAAQISRPTIQTLAQERVKCLFQGRFSPRRGMEELVLGWKHVDSAKAALFMRGPDNLWRQKCISLARDLGLLDKSVFFLDAVSEDQLVDSAREADVGLVPYLPDVYIYRYSCPNKLSQYMLAGLMVVTNNIDYVRSVVEEASAGLTYDSNDPGSLGRVINRIAGDPILLATCKQNALTFSRQRFNWQTFAEAFDSMYAGRTPVMTPV